MDSLIYNSDVFWVPQKHIAISLSVIHNYLSNWNVEEIAPLTPEM